MIYPDHPGFLTKIEEGRIFRDQFLYFIWNRSGQEFFPDKVLLIRGDGEQGVDCITGVAVVGEAFA